ncbi:DUF1302 domain-containing protein [Spartinivicinus ruber]|uniref:DUF1302 domain-containing protein n=1 Tax=Spartinivicinus ruber TaxID=2683272 RepID=UPI001CA42377|nr:DUF1302 domain-containing protein [Spartinivicinus ruber]
METIRNMSSSNESHFLVRARQRRTENQSVQKVHEALSTALTQLSLKKGVIGTAQLALRLVPARAGFVLASALAVLPAAHGVEFELMDGDVTGSLDTTLSYGAMWRVEGRDTRKYAGADKPTHDDVNTNDGNRNYDTGLVSNTYKITSELEINYANPTESISNVGAFVRGRAFYDSVVMDQSTDWLHANDQFTGRGYPDQTGTYPHGDGFSRDVENLIGKDASLLDAYVYTSFDVYDKPVDIRFGQQVLNWGEGLFYRGGINTINPIDAAQFSLPGSEVKDLLIPQMALSFNVGLTDSLSMEAFYMLEWDETIVPPRGSYFSNNDIFSEGADKGYNEITSDLVGLGAGYFFASGGRSLFSDFNINTDGDYLVVADTSQKKNSSDGGQWGVNFKYFAEELNDTEFGFYFVNYHSQAPFVQATVPLEGINSAVALLDSRAAVFNALGPSLGAVSPQFCSAGLSAIYGLSGNCANIGYAGVGQARILSNSVFGRRVFPEDIRMFGLSFNTTVGDTSIAGELTYRPNMPIWIDHPDDLVSGIKSNVASILAKRKLGQELCTGDTALGGGALSQGRPDNVACVGDWYNNYERVELWTGSLVFIHNFGPTLGFDGFMGLVEPHFERISGLGGDYDRFLSTGSGPYDQRTFSSDYTPAHERLDKFSWGYTLVASGTWNDVFAGVNLNPVFRFKHDVEGNSRRTGSFMEDRKAATIALNANYLGTMSAGISYTNFFGAERRNKLNDRDNIAVNFKYAF